MAILVEQQSFVSASIDDDNRRFFRHLLVPSTRLSFWHFSGTNFILLKTNTAPEAVTGVQSYANGDFVRHHPAADGQDASWRRQYEHPQH